MVDTEIGVVIKELYQVIGSGDDLLGSGVQEGAVELHCIDIHPLDIAKVDNDLAAVIVSAGMLVHTV